MSDKSDRNDRTHPERAAKPDPGKAEAGQRQMSERLAGHMTGEAQAAETLPEVVPQYEATEIEIYVYPRQDGRWMVNMMRGDKFRYAVGRDEDETVTQMVSMLAAEFGCSLEEAEAAASGAVRLTAPGGARRKAAEHHEEPKPEAPKPEPPKPAAQAARHDTKGDTKR